MNTNTSPLPSDWHVAPVEDTSACSICGCPVRACKPGGRRTTQHRKVDDGWQKRWKSQAGWKVAYVKPPQTPRQQPRQQAPKDPRYLSLLRHRFRRVAALVLTGQSIAGAARTLGLVANSFHHSRQRHRDIWDAEFAQAKTDYEQSGVVLVGLEPEPAISDRVRKGIRKACLMLAAGDTFQRVADGLGIGFEGLRDWSDRHPEFWKREYDYAMAAAAVIVRKKLGPAYAMENPGQYDRRVARLDEWARNRGKKFLPEPGGDETLRGFYEKVYRPQKLFGASIATDEHYSSILRMFCRFMGRDVTLDAITCKVLTDYLKWRLQSGCSSATVNGHRRALLAILRLARRKRLLEVDWLDDVPRLRVPFEDPEAFLVDEVEALVLAARQIEGDVCGIPARHWWPALILVIWNCGTRITATMSIRCSKVELDRRLLTVRAVNQKHKWSQTFTLKDETIDALRLIWSPGRELLFPWPYDPGRQWQSLTKRMRRIIDAAGLPQPLQPFHALRRSAGSYINQQAGLYGAQNFLGHTQSATTQKYLSARVGDFFDASAHLPTLQLDTKTQLHTLGAC